MTPSRLSDHQVAELATLEGRHTHLVRINEDHPLGDTMLQNELTGTAAFVCTRCGVFAVMDIDGIVLYYLSPKFLLVKGVYPSDQEVEEGGR